MQTIHYIMLACGSLATGLPNLEPAMPPSVAPYLRAATAILVLTTTVLGAVSSSVLPAAAIKSEVKS